MVPKPVRNDLMIREFDKWNTKSDNNRPPDNEFHQAMPPPSISPATPRLMTKQEPGHKQWSSKRSANKPWNNSKAKYLYQWSQSTIPKSLICQTKPNWTRVMPSRRPLQSQARPTCLPGVSNSGENHLMPQLWIYIKRERNMCNLTPPHSEPIHSTHKIYLLFIPSWPNLEILWPGFPSD